MSPSPDRPARWVVLAILAVLAVFAASTPLPARADGAFPDSQSILTPAARTEEIVLVTNFGLVTTEDGGATWLWSCEQSANAFGRLYQQSAPPLRRLFAIANQQLVYSDDGACGWTTAAGLVSDQNVTDAFADRGNAEHVLAVGSQCCDAGVTAYRAFESTNGGATFDTLLYAAEAGQTINGIEVAAADPRTLYLTLTGAGSPPAAIIARSTDAGASWQLTDLSSQIGPGALRLIAIDRQDPKTAFLLRTGASDQAVAVTRDGGLTAVKVLEPDGTIMNFIRLVSGTILIATDLNGVQSLFRSQDDAATFQSVFHPPHVRAFAERNGTVYAATDASRDGYAVGTTTDEGTTWKPFLRYTDLRAVVPCLKSACQAVCATEVGMQLFPAAVCSADVPPSSGTGGAAPPDGGGGGIGGTSSVSQGGAGAGAGGAATGGVGGSAGGRAGTSAATNGGGTGGRADNAGCRCEVTGERQGGGAWFIGVAAIAAFFRARRRLSGSSSRKILVARAALLLAASAALATALIVAERGRAASQGPGTDYVCPMHPAVKVASPGSCPVCGMALERVARRRPDALARSPAALESPDVLTWTGVPRVLGRHHTAVDRVGRMNMTSRPRAPAYLIDADHVVAVMRRDEIDAMSAAEAGSFVAALGGAPVEVKRASEPPRPRDASTALVRFDVQSGHSGLAVGTVGQVELPARSRDFLVVPLHAVIESPGGPYVLVASSDGRTFTRRSVEVGASSSSMAVVLSGVGEGDLLAVGDAFFLDAERRSRAQLVQHPRGE